MTPTISIRRAVLESIAALIVGLALIPYSGGVAYFGTYYLYGIAMLIEMFPLEFAGLVVVCWLTWRGVKWFRAARRAHV